MKNQVNAGYLHQLRVFSRDVRLYLTTVAIIGFTSLGVYSVLLNLYLLRLGLSTAQILDRRIAGHHGGDALWRVPPRKVSP